MSTFLSLVTGPVTMAAAVAILPLTGYSILRTERDSARVVAAIRGRGHLPWPGRGTAGRHCGSGGHRHAGLDG
jgi:hypothetical protein